MATALTALATTTLASSSATVTFSSISGSYRDLYISATLIYSGAATDVGFRVNGGTGTSVVYMAGNGSSPSSGTNSDVLGYATSAGITETINIFDYAQTDKHKSGLIRYGAAGNFAAAAAFRWASTSAITSLEFYLGSGTFQAGSTFSLFGVSA